MTGGAPVTAHAPAIRYRVTAVIVVLLALASAWFWQPGAARAAGPGLAVTTDVGELAVTPGGTATAQVIVSATGDQDLRSVALTLSVPHGVTATAPLTAAAGGVLRAGSSLLTTLTVTTVSGFTPGKVGLVATGTTATGSDVRAAGVVSLTSAALPAAPTAALAFPTDLLDGEHRTAGLTVANAAGPAFRDVVVRGRGSTDVDLRLACPAGTPTCSEQDGVVTLATLGAGETVVLDADLAVHRSVHGGAQSVTVVVTARPSVADTVAVSSQATAAVKLGVFGVDVLSPFGITTLFVLPGVLALVLFQLMCRRVYPRGAATEGLPDYKDPAAMALVVPVSIVGYIGVWLAFGHDLRYSVSTWDVLSLFLTGVGAALFAWTGLALTYHRRTGRKVFHVGDLPDVVLRKLALRGESLTRATLTAGGLLVLSRETDGSGTASGLIGYSFPDGAGGAREWEDAVTTDRVARLAELARPPRLLRNDPEPEVTLRWRDRTVTTVKDASATSGRAVLVTQVNA